MKDMRTALIVLVAVALVSGLVFAFVYGNAIQTKARGAVFDEGYQAGLDNVPVEACPYTVLWNAPSNEYREHWLRGWIAGRRALLKKSP